VDHVTLLRAGDGSATPSALSAALPPDLLEQVRGRVRLLALCLLIAFALDPVLFFGQWGFSALLHKPLPAGFLAFTLCLFIIDERHLR